MRSSEGLRIEPSAGLIGRARVAADAEYLSAPGLDVGAISECAFVAWITGGSMVPESEMASYLARAERSDHSQTLPFRLHPALKCRVQTKR